MKYLILDCCKRRSEVQQLEQMCRKDSRPVKRKRRRRAGSRRHDGVTMHRRRDDVMVYRKNVVHKEVELVYIILGVVPGDVNQQKPKQIRRKIRAAIGDTKVRVLDVLPGLEQLVPEELLWCEDKDEVYLPFVREQVEMWKNASAKLILLDDGTKNVEYYLNGLVQDWNYVTVCSGRHPQLENCYRNIYQTEGLMIQCENLATGVREHGDCENLAAGVRKPGDRENLTTGSPGTADRRCVMVDLTGNWKGIHHIYKDGAVVVDTTFSREKEEYLMAKQVKIEKYVQVAAVIRDLP